MRGPEEAPGGIIAPFNREDSGSCGTARLVAGVEHRPIRLGPSCASPPFAHRDLIDRGSSPGRSVENARPLCTVRGSACGHWRRPSRWNIAPIRVGPSVADVESAGGAV